MSDIINQVLDKINTGIIVIDSSQNIIIWNNWLEKYTKKLKNEVIGLRLSEICPKFAQEAYQGMLRAALFNGQSRFCSSALHKTFVQPTDRDENEVKQNLIIEPIYSTECTYVLLQIVDVTGYSHRVSKLRDVVRNLEVQYGEIKEAEQNSKQLALHDPLTELPNRLLLMDRLSWSINHSQRNNSILAVMFLDIDGFKEINDTYGHLMGDALLYSAAQRLKNCVRKTDTVARLGGDEFVIVLTQVNNLKNVEQVAKKIINNFNNHFDINGLKVKISVSIGISVYSKDEKDPINLIKNADSAMYKVKLSGKNNYIFFS